MSGEITRLLGWRKYANILTHVGHLPLRARARAHTHTRAHAHTELMETLDDVHTRTHAPTRARTHTHLAAEVEGRRVRAVPSGLCVQAGREVQPLLLCHLLESADLFTQ